MRWKTTALTLLFTLGAVGLASADDTGNWFTRMFSANAKKRDADKKSDEKADDSPAAALSPRWADVHKITQDWQRRLDVCTRLREIAIDTGDADLQAKAELLEKRVFDAWVAASNRVDMSRQVLGEISVKDLKAGDKAGKGKR